MRLFPGFSRSCFQFQKFIRTVSRSYQEIWELFPGYFQDLIPGVSRIYSQEILGSIFRSLQDVFSGASRIYSQELLGSIFRSFQDIFKGVSRICAQEFLGFILRSFLDLFSVSSRICSPEFLNLFSGASRIWSQEFLGSIQRSFWLYIFSGVSRSCFQFLYCFQELLEAVSRRFGSCSQDISRI